MNISTSMLFCIFLVENVIDSICTVVGINNGAMELNPFINLFINLHGPVLGIIMAKLIALMVLACILQILMLNDRARTVKMILWLGVIGFGFLDFIIHPYVLWVILRA
jgi:uncharacterized membrane protein